MSMPTIPDIHANINITRSDAINMVITSIAMEELSIAHILNAEGEKLQYVLGTLKGNDPGEITICDIMAVNNSIQKTLRDVIKAEMLLQLKLEDAIELDESGNVCQLTITGHKIWKDGNNALDTRPPSVEISLLRDNKVYKTTTVNPMGDGVYTFPCLPVWRDSENKYNYHIDETAVPTGYIKTVEGFNVINTAVITINGTKTWDDDDDDSKARPAEITVNLLQNGLPYRTLKITSPTAPVNTVQFKFDNEPRFDNVGNLYVYTLKEDPIAGYVTTIKGYDITNSLE